jgi:hypothetical protein
MSKKGNEWRCSNKKQQIDVRHSIGIDIDVYPAIHPPDLPPIGLGSTIMNTRVDHGDRRQSGTGEKQQRAELDDLTIRLYGAVDAARGAEAEKANALGLVRDLEYQVHMLEVEIDGLRAQLAESAPLRPSVANRATSVFRHLAARVRQVGVS